MISQSIVANAIRSATENAESCAEQDGIRLVILAYIEDMKTLTGFNKSQFIDDCGWGLYDDGDSLLPQMQYA